jgi:tetratricopeptide (TPR) repeat protein
MTNRCKYAAILFLMSLNLQAQDATSTAPPDAIKQALADLKQGQPQQALDLLRQAIAADPNDAAANLLAAGCAISLYRPDLAVSYGERARGLEPDNWKIHATLVTAYAMAGKMRERDAERAALHELHTSAKIPDAAQTSGFLLDRFKVKQYSVDAVEYFTPVGKFHIYYRFLIRNSRGQRAWRIDVQSDDYNQASWAKAYPQAAAQGQRQFQLTGEGNGVRNDYRSFSGSADYDWVKARVIEIINAQSVPFPGEPAEPGN